MAQFKNAHASHAHSLQFLNMLYEYDDFMDSLEVIVDMGCGSGQDLDWWATLEDREDPPEPHNYVCYGVDLDVTRVDPATVQLPNVKLISGNFEHQLLPRSVDFVWCHDSFQYVVNPLQTLAVWNRNMNANAMLALSLPLHQSHQYNRMVTRSYNGCFHHYNICNLMYMLATSGFDCRDCFFQMEENVDWLNIAVYKTMEPLDPATTTWYHLAELGLVNDSVIQSLNRYGHVRQEELLFNWLDRNFYFAKN
jgi:trans-aconitate methyltransferase